MTVNDSAATNRQSLARCERRLAGLTGDGGPSTDPAPRSKTSWQETVLMKSSPKRSGERKAIDPRHGSRWRKQKLQLQERVEPRSRATEVATTRSDVEPMAGWRRRPRARGRQPLAPHLQATAKMSIYGCSTRQPCSQFQNAPAAPRGAESAAHATSRPYLEVVIGTLCALFAHAHIELRRFQRLGRNLECCDLSATERNFLRGFFRRHRDDSKPVLTRHSSNSIR